MGCGRVAVVAIDIDGDTLADVVTSYSLDGVPHAHATLATGGDSDAEVPIGNADTVSIQFMDFDYALGAEVPPPAAVVAIGPTKAGTAVGAFLTLTFVAPDSPEVQHDYGDITTCAPALFP